MDVQVQDDGLELAQNVTRIAAGRGGLVESSQQPHYPAALLTKLVELALDELCRTGSLRPGVRLG